MKQLFVFTVFALILLGCIGQRAPTQESGQAPFQPAPVQDLQRAKALQTANAGDAVRVDYVGSLENGTVFDSSIEREAKKAGLVPRPTYEPIEFTIGEGAVITGFENAVIGMRVGEEKTVKVRPIEAYGERTQEAIIAVNRSLFGNESTNLSVGKQFLTITGPAQIIALNETHATIDLNHPLAGKTLVFKIILREIKPRATS